MTKARDLANFVSAGNPLADGTIDPADINGVTASAAELNILDGATVTTAELNVLDGITADVNELNVLDGITTTVAELNVLDGITADVNELNVLDGITADVNELNILDGVTATTAELNYNDITTLGTSEASKVVTADANGNVILAEEVQATCYLETAVSVASTTIDCDEGNLFYKTISANTTFTFDYSGVNLTTDDAYAFTLILTVSGTRTVTWPASVDWAGGTAPDAPASGETDVLVFVTRDGGTNWYGFQAGDALA